MVDRPLEQHFHHLEHQLLIGLVVDALGFPGVIHPSHVPCEWMPRDTTVQRMPRHLQRPSS